MSLSVNIKKRLDAFELDVSFEIEGGTLALLGASGSGKSMTLKCIAGIEKPDEGRIVLNGKVLFDSEKKIDLPPQKRRIGYLFQQYALFPNMTVWQNIRTGVRDKSDADETIRSIIKNMGLEGTENTKPAFLSGGQQQRVALARILVNEPEVLLLDEPFSALDEHLRFNLESKTREILKSFGKPSILVSHDKEEVFRMSDRIAVLDMGKIDAIGTKHEVFENPVTKNSAALTGCRNISRVEFIGPGRLYAKDWEAELEIADCPENIEFAGIHAADIIIGGNENTISCIIREVVENPFTDILMLCKEGSQSAATIMCETEKGLWQKCPDGRVEISIPKNKIMMLKG